MGESEDIYDSTDSDPFQFLEAAEGARKSSDVLFEALLALRNKPPSSTRIEMLGFMRSCMLLRAVALELLCKALATQENPRGWRKLRGRGGHAVSCFVKSFVSVSAEEAHLIERLETYRVWAGTFPLPKEKKTYEREHSRRSLISSDRTVFDTVYNRLLTEFERRRA
jgi:hypothetical protein